MVRKIPFGHGFYTEVDDDTYEELSKFKWYGSKRNDGNIIPARKNKTLVFMHRQIIGAKKGEIVDHIDRNTLNNQISNLRIVTTFQSSCNTKSRKNSTSKFKGVSWNKRRNRWRVVIMKNQKQIYVGTFTDEVEAAKSYDVAAKNIFGEYAVLNFNGEDQCQN